MKHCSWDEMAMYSDERKKKLLVVSRNFWPEKTSLTDICLHLNDLGYQTDVLCGQPSDENGEFIKGYNSFKVRRESHEKLDIFRTVDIKKGEDSNLRLYFYYISFPFFSRFLIKKIAQREYDAVLIYQTSPVMMADPGLKIARRLNVPAYIYIAELWPERLFDVLDVRSLIFRKSLYSLSDWYYRKADALIATSEKMKKYLSKRLSMAVRNIYMIPPFSDRRYENLIMDESLLEKMAGSFKLLIIEGRDARLDTDSVIQAAMLIRNSRVRNIRFIVIGAGGDISELKKKVRKQSLEDMFYFEGKVSDEDMGKYLYMSDIILCAFVPGEAGEYEASSQLIRVMAAGRPVIVTSEGTDRDIISESGCGIAASVQDGENLCSCILKIYDLSQQERQQLGAKAWNYMHDHFDPDDNARELSYILEGVSDDTPADNTGIQSLDDV